MKPTIYQIGQTVLGQSIERVIFSNPASRVHVLMLAGVHGDEVEGIRLIEEFQRRLESSEQVPCNIHLVPCLNLDGWQACSRTNARGVDLNRNLSTKDWGSTGHTRMDETDLPPEVEAKYYPGEAACSEPENIALTALIKERLWKGVLSFHSFEKTMVNYNGEHSQKLAMILSEVCGLPAKDDIGYPTPGSLGTLAGIEKKLPCITLELKRGMSYYADLTPFLDALWKACEQHDAW